MYYKRYWSSTANTSLPGRVFANLRKLREL